MDALRHDGNLVTPKTSLVKQFRVIVGCFAKATLSYKNQIWSWSVLVIHI